MPLTNMPAALDTWTPPRKVAKLQDAVDAISRIVVGPTHINARGYGAAGNGVDNDSAAIASALAAGAAGGVLRFPAGEYKVNPGTLQMLASRHILGDGADSTWFTLASDTSGAALLIDITIAGGSVRGQYGSRVKGIGVDLNAAPNATGIRIGEDGGNGLHSGWTWLDDIRVEGGKVSIDVQSVNTKLSNFHLINPSVSFITIPPAGQEFRCWDGVLDCGPGHTVPIAVDIPILVGGAAGAVYMRDVALNNGGTVNRGIYEHAPNGVTASVPLRCTNVTLDNLAGPGFDLVNVSDAQIMGGWVNAAAGTTNGAIRFFGGGLHTIMGVEQLNGGSAGSSFDFAGGFPTGIVLIGNNPATAPCYKLSATEKPANLLIHDRIAAAAVIQNVTNDPEGLRAAMAPLWTPPREMQRRYVRETGTNPPAGYATLVAGQVIVAHSGVTAATRVRVWRERPGGTTGDLYSSVVDNNPGVHFMVKSTSATDTSGVYWEMYDPV